MIKAVVFDWGGVLIKHPVEEILEYCANEFKVDKDSLREAFQPYSDSFQKGTLQEQEMWERIATDLRVDNPKKLLWGESFQKVYTPKPEMFDLVDQLKASGYQVGFLSNTEAPMVDFFHRNNYGSLFEQPVFSCEEGIVKPDAKIYELTAQRLGLPPQNIVFIDDKSENVIGAHDVGMAGILYKNSEDVVKQLKDLGLKF